MSTCKDCVHYYICPASICANCYGLCDECGVCSEYGGRVKYEICEDFKDRSKFIELPCKLGDKVFYFDTAGRIYKQTIFQFIYGGTGLKLDSDVMFDSELIGKRFFLSREEAEKALKEREKK